MPVLRPPPPMPPAACEAPDTAAARRGRVVGDRARRRAETADGGRGRRVTGRCARIGVHRRRAAVGTPPTSRRRSRRSRRAAYPCSPEAAGRRMRAQISSSCSRGAVAPVISVRPVLTMSAARESAPGPKPACCTRMRSSWSSGTPRSTCPAPSGIAATMMRSRRRSSRSSTKRRGSWPDSMTLSIWRKVAAPSPAASASTVLSSSSPSVKPSSDTAPS